MCNVCGCSSGCRCMTREPKVHYGVDEIDTPGCVNCLHQDVCKFRHQVNVVQNKPTPAVITDVFYDLLVDGVFECQITCNYFEEDA